jgi:hypothetical protein
MIFLPPLLVFITLAAHIVAQGPCLPLPITTQGFNNVSLISYIDGIYQSGAQSPTPSNSPSWSVITTNHPFALPGEYLDVSASLTFNAVSNSYELSYTCNYNLSGVGVVYLDYAQYLNWTGCSSNGMLRYVGGTSDPNKNVFTMNGPSFSDLSEGDLTTNPELEVSTNPNWIIPNSTYVVGQLGSGPLIYTGTGVHVALISIQFYPGLDPASQVNINPTVKPSWTRGVNPSLAVVDYENASPGTMIRLLVFGVAGPNIALTGISGTIGLDISKPFATFIMTESASGDSAQAAFNTPVPSHASYLVSGLRSQVFYITLAGVEAGDAIDF